MTPQTRRRCNSDRLLARSRGQRRDHTRDTADPRPGETEQSVCRRFYPVMENLAARMAATSGDAPDNLLSDCHVGIVKAIRNFNPRLGYRFTTFATTVMVSHMHRGLKERDPVSTQRRRMRDALAGRDGAGATPHGFREDASPDARQVALADSVLSWDDLGVPLDRIHASAADTAAIVTSALRVADLLDNLPEREADMVRLYFFKGKQYEEIGATFSISKQRVEQIVKHALRRLRRLLSEQGDEHLACA